MNSQLILCGHDAAITPAVVTNGLKIKFDSKLELSSPSRNQDTSAILDNRQLLRMMYFLQTADLQNVTLHTILDCVKFSGCG